MLQANLRCEGDDFSIVHYIVDRLLFEYARSRVGYAYLIISA